MAEQAQGVLSQEDSVDKIFLICSFRTFKSQPGHVRVTAEAGLLDRANQVKFLKGSADTLPLPSLIQPLCPPHLGPQHLFSLLGPSIRILVPVSSF